MHRIYVSISSYRDAELIPTILDLVNKANKPERLNIAVAWQFDDCESIKCVRSNISTLFEIPFIESKGVCWARHKIQEAYDGEEYILQLDSHHRFIKNWDVQLMSGIKTLRKCSAKPLISTYLPNYDLTGKLYDERFKIEGKSYTKDGLLFLTPTNFQSNDDYIQSHFLSGHFIFGPGEFYQEVKYDPDLYFYGEEVSLSAKAHTYGYDVYVPNYTAAYHLYDRNYRPLHWHDHTLNNQVVDTWNDMDRRSIKKYVNFFTSPSKVNKHYVGSSRTLRSYIKRLKFPPVKIN